MEHTDQEHTSSARCCNSPAAPEGWTSSKHGVSTVSSPGQESTLLLQANPSYQVPLLRRDMGLPKSCMLAYTNSGPCDKREDAYLENWMSSVQHPSYMLRPCTQSHPSDQNRSSSSENTREMMWHQTTDHATQPHHLLATCFWPVLR